MTTSIDIAMQGEKRARLAVGRLVAIAQRDTGQSRRVANFLLAWWNAHDNGGFDLTDMWAVDSDIAADMVTVFTYVATHQHYADHFGYSTHMHNIWKQWRERTA